MAADQECALASAKDYTEKCLTPPSPSTGHPLPGGLGCVCGQATNGFPIAGTCVAPAHCQAGTVGALGGGTSAVGAGSLGLLAGAVGGLLGALLMSPSSQDTSVPASTATTGVCTSSYYAESDTPTPTDPCAYYVAPSTTIAASSTTSTTCDALSQALGMCNGTLPVVTPIIAPSTTPIITPTGPVSVPTTTPVQINPATAQVTGSFGGQGVATVTPPGLTGSIQTTGTGATFVTNDTQGNTETSTFFGGDAIGGFVSDLVGGWCQSRPWASGFIASIIPPSFFDGLCTAGGFTVGTPPAAAPVQNAQAQTSVVLTQTPVQTTPTVVQALAPSAPALPARVDIWAVPPSVPLGSRTTIFWNTENVTQCSETSPDGSFSQSSLSGGAATVPLTEPTTYSISCVDAQGNPQTDYITVEISG